MTSEKNQPSVRGRGILMLAFAVYLLLLAWVVLWKLEAPWIGDAASRARPLKLVPFVESGDAGASAPIEVLINLVIFVPFGLFLGTLAPSWSWWKAGATVLGTSLGLEIVQHLISTGSFDTTDLIVNTAGGLAGYGILALIRRRLGARAPAVMVRVCVTIAALALVAVVAIVASPLHYGPQRCHRAAADPLGLGMPSGLRHFGRERNPHRRRSSPPYRGADERSTKGHHVKGPVHPH